MSDDAVTVVVTDGSVEVEVTYTEIEVLRAVPQSPNWEVDEQDPLPIVGQYALAGSEE